MVPLLVMPVAPVIAPPVDMSRALELIEKLSPPSPRATTPFAVNVPFAVNPLVAVMSPEIVGVAVQAVLLKVVVMPDLPRVRLVALVVPILRDPALSTIGVVTDVANVPVAPVNVVVLAVPIVPVVVILLAPLLMFPNPLVILPALRAPTVVREEVITPDPSVLLVKTSVPAILYEPEILALPATSSFCPGVVEPIPTFPLALTLRIGLSLASNTLIKEVDEPLITKPLVASAARSVKSAVPYGVPP